MGIFSDALQDFQDASPPPPDATPPPASDYGQTYGGPTGVPRIDVAPPKKVNAAIDFAKSIPGGVVSGTGNILSAVGNAANLEMSQPNNPTVSPEEAKAAITENVTGPLPEPEGSAGKYGRAIGEFLPYMLTGPPQGGVVRTGIAAVAPAIASETAGQLTEGTPFEAPARIGATVVSGLLAGARAPSSAQIESQAAKVAPRLAEVPTTEQLLSTGAQQINAAESVATKSFSPGTMDQLVSNIQDALKTGNSRDYLDPGTWSAINELKNETTADGVQKVRSFLGTIGQRNHGAEGRAVGIAQGEIDKFLKNAEPAASATLEEGRANYAAGMRSKESDIRGQIAELRANRAGYGGAARAVNAIRQQLSPVVEAYLKGDKGGLSPEEFKAMYDIVHGTRATNALRAVGMFSPEKGSFPFVATLEAAREIGPEAAAGIPVISYAANKLAHIMTEGQIERLNTLIRQRSPLYKNAVSNAMAQYGQTMNDLYASPSQRSFIKFLVASRNLSAGFRKDGIPLSSGDLLKGISAAPAEEGREQQQGSPPIAGK